MRKMVINIIIALLAFYPSGLSARKFSLSTDLMGYAELGTFNAEASYALSRRVSLNVGARYNPFTFNEGEEGQFQYRQQSYSVGARVWPWHIWSGWWMAGKLRYQEYNKGGLISSEAEEGDRFGAGLYSGYTYMLNPHFNIEVGVGMWAGVSYYDRYSCPTCGLTVESGVKYFLLPDDFMISLVYVF